MAYDGTLKFDTAMDTSGFQKDTKSLNDLVKGLAVFDLLKRGFDAIAESVGAAVERYDTLNRFPKVLQQMGYSSEDAATAAQKLSDGVRGLPTTLDGIVSNAQRLTVLTGNLDLATDTTLALNNAFLASGSTAADAERGLTQYVQQLAKGKPDMQSWRTLQETMGYALSKTAEAFGFAGESAQNDLYDALRDGTITFSDFNAKIIELNGGVGGFAELAKTATGGIGTAWTNLKTAIVRETANILTAIDDGLSETKFQSIENTIGIMRDGVVLALGFVADAFTFVAQNIEPISIGLAALAVTIGLVKFLSLAGQAGSLTGALLRMTPAIITLTAAKVKDGVASAYLTALYVKDAIVKGASTVATWAMSAATKANTIATQGFSIAQLASTIATKAAAVATALWGAAMSALPLIALVAGIAAVVAGVVALVMWFNRSGKAYESEKTYIEDLTEAHKEYQTQLARDTAMAQESRNAKMAEIETNKATAASLQELIAKNDEAGKMNHAIAATVNQLNESMTGLGLAYDSTTGKLNMTDAELQKYINNLATVSAHQLNQDEYNRLLQEQNELQQKITTQEAKKSQYYTMYKETLITQGEYLDLIDKSNEYTAQLTDTLAGLTIETEAAGRAAEASYSATAEAAVKAVQIQNNEMDAVRALSKTYDVSADVIIRKASQMAGGLTEWEATAKRTLTSTGKSIEDVATQWDVSIDEINGYLDDNGASLDDYAAYMESMTTDAGLSLSDLATKWGTTARAIERTMVENKQTAQQWEDAQLAALDAVREYAIQSGDAWYEINIAAREAGLSVDDYVASQRASLTEAGMDIQQVADYWGVSVDVIQGHMEKWQVSLDQAHQDMAAMRTSEGQTLDQLARKYEMTSDEVKAAAAGMGVTWQEWGDSMNTTVAELAEAYGVAADQIIAESQNMTGGLEAWATQAEQQHQRALVAEQDYVDQIKAGNVEIDAAYAQSLEARRVNGEQLNAIEQATLEQWSSINQAAVEAYKAQQQQIVDAAKARADEISVAEQQSAEEVLRIQAANNAATAQYVENYNAIWGQIPPSQRQYLAELDIDSAKFLADMVSKWDEGGKEQWETYIDGIEEGKTTASQLAGEAAGEVGGAFIEGTTSKEPEVKQAGTDMADATGEGMKASTAPSEASQEIADAVIRDLTNADYSGITGGIAAAITGGTGAVTAAASTMCASVEAQLNTMKTKSVSTTDQMMTSINSSVVTRSATVQLTVTALSNGVTTILASLKTKATSTTEQMMTSINSAIVTRAATVKSSTTSMSNGVVSALSTMVSGAKSAANQMMDGMLSAMNAKAQALYDKAREIANKIAATLRSALDVHSPSRVMIKIFEWVMLGIYEGMASMEGMLFREADSIAEGIADRLTISPDVLHDVVDQLRTMTEANPLGGAALVPQAAGGLIGGVSYTTNLTQQITTPKPLSASEMTREGQDLLRRSRWQLP